MSGKKIYRSKENRIIAGVAAGIAEYFETDPVIVRIIFIFLSFGGGAGILVYLFLWLMIPERGQEKHKPMTEEHPEDEHEHGHKVGHDKNHTHGVAGFFLIIIGLLFLINNFFPTYPIEKYWPLVIIFLGVAVMFRKHY